MPDYSTVHLQPPRGSPEALKLESEVIYLADLSPDDQSALADELFPVHQQIFAGLSQEEFVKYVLHDHANSTWIEIFRRPDGRPAGYCALHQYERTFNGRLSTIFRAEAGLLPDYRGQTSTWSFPYLRAFLYRIRHPFRPLYYLGMLVHPSSYCLISERFSDIHPNRRNTSSPEILAAMAELADTFDIPAVDDNGLIRAVGWITRQTPEQEAMWKASDHPDVRFYLRANPDYTAGHGLVTLVPLTLASLAGDLVGHILLKIGVVRRRSLT